MDNGQRASGPGESSHAAENRTDPPFWLEVGDESWGPTSLKKRKARSLPGPPELPNVWATGDEPQQSPYGWLKTLATILALIRGEHEAFYAHIVRLIATWGAIAIAGAAIWDWLK